MEKLPQTPSQTVGPYFAYGLTPEQYLYDFKTVVADAIDGVTSSHPVNFATLTGRILDGEGKPIPDAMIELWSNDGGRQHFARCGTGTDAENRYFFQFQKPAPVNGQAPFLTLVVFMRGQLIHSFTRVYFEDEAELNAGDEVLNSVPAARRHTLIAKQNAEAYEFDIWMQGAEETVFFDL